MAEALEWAMAGWNFPDVGDLSQLLPNEDSFKKYRAGCPSCPPGYFRHLLASDVYLAMEWADAILVFDKSGSTSKLLATSFIMSMRLKLVNIAASCKVTCRPAIYVPP